MNDFIITGLISLFTNMYIVATYWDPVKEYQIAQGYPMYNINIFYYAMCGASYLAIGLIVYLIIFIVKRLLSIDTNY